MVGFESPILHKKIRTISTNEIYCIAGSVCLVACTLMVRNLYNCLGWEISCDLSKVKLDDGFCINNELILSHTQAFCSISIRRSIGSIVVWLYASYSLQLYQAFGGNRSYSH